MFNGNFDLTGETLEIVEEIGRHMPGGFFIYESEMPEKLIFANQAVFDIFGCEDLEDFKELTGYTFKGMLHPEDYAKISDSIVEQIEQNEDNMDYVEYRIIKKDGAVRWVDDFGHYSETKNHGGVYYVFISDITEKKQERDNKTKRVEEENRRLVEEIESAARLADLMGSASSLLTNMPAMSFSKDAETGRYLACNQSFAEYAHKNDPSEVVGLTDYEIFDKKTADHFVSDDAKAVSMDTPYIFFEDVPDAGGKLRNLQTTKMKFTEPSGRLCTLGLCVDVTEMMRIKSAEAEARIKQQELEEKIELQEKLLSQSRSLRKALKDAEEANRSKSNFLSNMSHEIRTPITAILGMNELIRRESTNETVLEYSASIDKAGNSLLGIIDDILDFSKIEAGRMELVAADYKVADLMGDLYNLIRFRIEEKGLVFRTEIDPSLPVVINGDELRIKQIITNLLSNAAKYTEKGTVTLTVSVASKNNEYVDIYVAVKDTGIGIREEDKDKLFSAFDRLDVSRTHGIEGTGLGLAITSQMLRLMDSELKVDSTYGNGSTFSFTIRQSIVDGSELGSFDPAAPAVSHLEDDHKATGFIAPDARLLIVDDTPLNLQVIVGLLKRTQVQIDTAPSGEECIRIFGSRDYDMVFLDYRMPDMDGIETLKELKRLYPEKTKRTPILSLTASAVVGDRERMLIAGFDDYLPKPVNTAKMEQMIIRYLPEDKVKLVELSEEDDALKQLPPAIFGIKELDPAAGIGYCGDAEDYLNALGVYRASIDQKAEDIDQALQSKDMDKYLIMVHSLKSTSRAIGAPDIYELALALERAAKDSDTGLLVKYTPELLKRYRSLKEQLNELFKADT